MRQFVSNACGSGATLTLRRSLLSEMPKTRNLVLADWAGPFAKVHNGVELCILPASKLSRRPYEPRAAASEPRGICQDLPAANSRQNPALPVPPVEPQAAPQAKPAPVRSSTVVDHSLSPRVPSKSLEAWPRIELGCADLQSAASPLRHQAARVRMANRGRAGKESRPRPHAQLLTPGAATYKRREPRGPRDF